MFPAFALLPAAAELLTAADEPVLVPEAALDPDPDAGADEGATRVAVSTGVVETADAVLSLNNEKVETSVISAKKCRYSGRNTHGAPFSTVKKEAMTRLPSPLLWTYCSTLQ